MSIGSALPASFPAGTTVEYTKSFTDYRADQGWGMQLVLSGPSKLTVDATASGAAFAFAITAAASAKLKSGRYTWIERATKSAKVYDAATDFVVVTPNVAAAGAGDLQTYEEKMLAQIEAGLLARSAGTALTDADEYEIDGIHVVRPSREVLTRERSRLIASINRMRTGRLGRPVQVTFGSSSGRLS